VELSENSDTADKISDIFAFDKNYDIL